MRVYSRRTNPPTKDQQPFFGAKDNITNKAQPFFKASNIQRKKEAVRKAGEPEQKKPEEEAKMQKKDQEIEEPKVQKAPDPEKEPQDKVQSKTLHRKVKYSSETIRQLGPAGAAEVNPALEQRLLASKGNGFALPDDLLQELNSKMQYDFSSVIIHTDAEAVKMAEELGALAFTHGNDIYFNRHQYAPYASSGRQLLVHELTHVMQQAY
ncbi:eCIS core domain-containing protein [Adhaeribacter rhizoryzae]|uniref:DUF4157 domain-containing protein n=1 Tax=Adhaeribacter rhizoryzae TaxID=2607907 RepID=A0A5M6DSN9_9BACT|nr:DUF4157 domain-containing protein [Adhaeribacter rhizoryzae]KAA5548435.1 DUF4157 domain-containing protein [Adhaeribacter rhizoryzae]